MNDKKFFIHYFFILNMEKEVIGHLNQLIKSLEDSVAKLEIAHDKKDSAEFDKIKKFMTGILAQIQEILQ